MIVHTIPIQALMHSKDFSIDHVQFDLSKGGTKKLKFPENLFHYKPKEALYTSNYVEPIDNIPWLKYLTWQANGSACLRNRDCLYKITPKKNRKVYEVGCLNDYADMPLNKKFYPRFKELQRMGFDGIHICGDARKALYGNRRYTPNFYNSFVEFHIAYGCDTWVWFNTDWIEDISHPTIVNVDLVLDYLEHHIEHYKLAFDILVSKLG